MATRVGIDVEQGTRGHQDAAQAIPALASLFLDEGLLEWVKLRPMGEALYGNDLSTFNCADRKEARAFGPSVNVDGARAAFPGSAPEAGPLQPEVIAQDVQKRRVRLRGRFDLLTIDAERDRGDIRHRRRIRLHTFQPEATSGAARSVALALHCHADRERVLHVPARGVFGRPLVLPFDGVDDGDVLFDRLVGAPGG